MIDKRLKKLWPQLQGKKQHLPHHLDELRLWGIRGIHDLKVTFDYPVSVIAGGNASGKSTVLFAAACAYKVPGAGVRDFVPSTLFPDYRPKHGGREDGRQPITIEFEYSTPDGRRSMRWRRAKGWSRSFFGRKGAAQPERPVHLHTLTNLSNPSEVRGVLRMSHLKDAPEEIPLTASQISFAQQMLPFNYSDAVKLSSGNKNLLFVEQEAGASYSELQMAAGERAILRLSQEIAQLKGALVLIDEVEAGLHPWVQQLLMLQLQQLALRNDLQIIVTSHSPVVLNSVPVNGRIFLERTEDGRVVLLPPHRDIIQDALYGRSHDMLNLLCEDDAAEGILHGVLDHLAISQEIRRESIRVGRDTGASEFPMHAAAFSKFGLLDDFAFVLDGDQRDSGLEQKIRDAAGRTNVPVLFLPSNHAPEVWLWERLQQAPERWANGLGTNPESLAIKTSRLDATYDSAGDTPANIAKTKLHDLAAAQNRSASQVCRLIAYSEAADEASDLQPLLESLKDLLLQWRTD